MDFSQNLQSAVKELFQSRIKKVFEAISKLLRETQNAFNCFLLFLNLVSLFSQGKLQLQLRKRRRTRKVVKQTRVSHQADSYHRRTPDCQLRL